MSIITIISYKSSGYTTLRGCVVDTWDSDFEMKIFEDLEESIKYLGDQMNCARSSRREYEYNILIDGKDEYYIYEDEDEAILKQVSDGARKYLQEAIKAENELIETSRQNEAKQKIEEKKHEKEKMLENIKKRISPESIEADRLRIKQLEEKLKKDQ
jgi:hypothetical protein